MKTAICQVSDTGPLESLAVMLEAAGYQAHLPNPALQDALRALRCDNVEAIARTMYREGVERPFDLPSAGVRDMATADLYVDIKAQRNAEKVWAKWKNLSDKTLWYRINGGQPVNVPHAGIETDPICPILTPNLWYRQPYECEECRWVGCMPSCPKGHAVTLTKWWDKAYAVWPPFYRFDEYYTAHGRPGGPGVLEENVRYGSPVCFVHNLQGWGYGGFAPDMAALGVKMYGNGSPDGLIQHDTIPRTLSRAIAYVHLKNNDAPGYALYEALSAACPVVVSQRLIWKNQMEDLFVHGQTCLVWDTPEGGIDTLHHSHTESEIRRGVEEVKRHLETLRDPAENRRIGLAGRQRLYEVMWNPDRPEDTSSLCRFLAEHYGE